MDTLFGTRYHTVGATLQLPRKVPMRVEPKSFFGEPRAAGGGNLVALAAAWRCCPGSLCR